MRLQLTNSTRIFLLLVRAVINFGTGEGMEGWRDGWSDGEMDGGMEG